MPSLNHIIDLLLSNKDFMNDRFGIEHVYLFGYNSLNEEKNLSKINILYENNKDFGMPLGRLINLEKYIKETIGIERFDLISMKNIHPVVYHHAEKSLVKIF